MSLSSDVLDLINEMAFPKSMAEGRVTNLGNSIIDHLLKVLKWKDPRNEKKHINDINGWIIQVYAITLRNNRKIKQRDYYQWLYHEHLTGRLTPKKHLDTLKRRGYDKLPSLRSDEEVLSMLDQIYQQLSYDLTLDTVPDIRTYLPGVSKSK
ncbi:hypothetical protein Nwat_2805 [Nitrosococcus watsonii C-113]|uniref:Uncharacterized protein n=1 Tax=Nitrosococcus watsoni (strain C-113) TaxID=105559 RepID=D8KBB6_NITWC|nr:hypothetical protein Nwat_2805 [Nitrosococcus watsonii C-113]